ncbi:MAG: folylpolyglutamate synthase/dihydrofolate synthase family protein [Candidatus Brocadiia bacterium]
MKGNSRLISTYEEAVGFLEAAINYEKTVRWQYGARTLNLGRTRELLTALGNPQERYRILHVAGTKGKGTTCGAAAHILTRHGLRTGLLTSPHLVTHRERLRVDGEMIPREDFVRGVRAMQPHVEAKRAAEATSVRAPTYFEMLTALGLHYFARASADWAVVEVGLGGRLDSTNVVQPRCCVVTAIGFDHTDKLGETIEEIAGEKAGIFKEGVPVVLGPQPYAGALDKLRAEAERVGCPRWEVGREARIADAEPLCAPADRPDAPVGWRFSLRAPSGDYRNLRTPLLGRHQLGNLATAVAALETCAGRGEIELDAARVTQAISEFRIEGRMELVRRAPTLILDTAHTVESVQALLDALEVHFPGRPVRVVFGCSEGKKARGMIEQMRGRCIEFVATQAELPRAMAAEDVLEAARQAGLAPAEGLRTAPEPPEAARQAVARARAGDVVVCTGSFYTTGEIRAALSLTG